MPSSARSGLRWILNWSNAPAKPSGAARTLFRNMNSIDFKGDGETGEYGSGYISLEPVPSSRTSP